MERFVGNPTLSQVRQPEGSELCFAALSASVSGEALSDVDQALRQAFLSEADGSTSPPFGDKRVVLGDSGKTLSIEVVQGYDQEASDVEGVIKNIDAKLREGTPVALLFNKTDDPEIARLHWVLLTGYTYARDSDIIEGVSIMDPEREDKYLANPLEVVEMIDRSMGTTGVFAYAMSLETPAAAE